MRRIRLVFAALAVVLLVPMGWLVSRALDSVVFSREVQHQTVAERVFDEMERPLADFARREDARPFGQYRFYLAPGSGRGAGELRSPLSHPPREPFVVGYFQLDPDGSFHSPLVPRDPDQARARGDWVPSPEVQRSVEELRSVAMRGLGAKRERVFDLELLAARPQAPGTTRKSLVAAKPEAPAEANAEAMQRKLEKSDAYRVLSRLNRAGQERDEYKGRAQEYAGRVAPYAGDGPSIAAESAPSEEALARLDQRLGAAAPAPAPAAGFGARAADAVLDADDAGAFDRGARSHAAAAAPPRRPAAAEPLAAARLQVEAERADHLEGRVALDAMKDAAAKEKTTGPVAEVQRLVGALVDERHLVLSRSVLVEGRAFRQGVVLEVPALQAAIGGPVVAALGGDAQLEFLPTSSDGEFLYAPRGYAYQHRFAVPFDPLSAHVNLPTLADAEGTGYLPIVSLLLLVAAAVGLFAVYRMVSVTVSFAERRSNFVAAVSHELKTPLTAIRMYGEMLRDGIVASEEKRAEYFSTITAESERLTRLINNVLEFSRLEQGTREMTLVAGALGPVVEEAARLLEPYARETGFEIRVELAPDLPAVRFDRDAVLQVVFNLVDNAVKYARTAPDRVITLQCSATSDGVLLAVRDRGPGVASRHLSKIFEPFYRGEKELTRTAKGTGIGLALVKGLAERMGAAVAGRNASDGGFEVTLRFRTA